MKLRMAKASLRARVGLLICAWCSLVLREGDKDLPVSHGCCVKCSDRILSELS
jgi:hypothetical protein